MKKNENNSIVAGLMQGASIAPETAEKKDAESPRAAAARPSGKKRPITVTLSSLCADKVFQTACERALESGSRISEATIFNDALDALRDFDEMDGIKWPLPKREALKPKTIHLTPENHEWVRKKSVSLKRDNKPFSTVSEIIEFAVLTHLGENAS